MKKIILFFLIFFPINTFAQNGWIWQNPSSTNNDLEDAFYLNSNLGYTSGTNGTILKTIDGGENWTTLNSGTVYNLYTLFFLNENTGFAGGGYPSLEGVIYKTTNGGLSWFLLSTFNNGKFIKDILFINDNTGFIAGDGFFAKTINGGLNWSITIHSYYTNNVIYFINSNTGFIGSNGNRILKTTNCGDSWQSLIDSQLPELFSISFINENTGFISCNWGKIFKTTNQGNNWMEVNVETIDAINQQTFKDINVGADYAIYNIKFCDSLNGIAVGGVYILNSNYGFILKTSDGGNNWQNVTLPDNHKLKAVSYLSKENIITHGHRGTICKSTNGGNNWFSAIKRITSSSLRDIKFINSNTGFIVGSPATFIKTSDGGYNWVEIPTGLNRDWNSISFVDENTGYATGGYSVYLPPWGANFTQIYKTTNSGIHWNLIYETGGTYGQYIHFINANTGFMLSRNIMRTTNAGQNWQIHMTVPGGLSELHFLNNSNNMIAYACGYQGKICKSTDGGYSWVTSNIEANFTLNSIYFTSYSTGYTCGYNNIYKTTNEGQNWSLQVMNVLGELRSISFLNENTGYISAQGGMFKTTNGGLNWYQDYSPYIGRSNKVLFLNSQTGYVVGEEGTIIKTTSGGTPININPYSQLISDNYILSQNFPNPFNPSTKIKFQIPKSSFVSLKIYDLIGREVETLVSENLNTGEYQVQWNASNFPSGVYFYKLQTDNLTETKKMLLVK